MVDRINECSGLRVLDPVQGLVDYVNDIKPYHTKIVEVLVEYVYEDQVGVTIGEDTQWVIDSVYPGDASNGQACYGGYGTQPYGGPGLWPILSPNVAGYNLDYPNGINGQTFSVPGNRTGDLVVGGRVEIVDYVEDYSALYDIIGVSQYGSPLQSCFIVDTTGSPPFSHLVGSVVETVGNYLDDGRSFYITDVVPDVPEVGQTTVCVHQSILLTVPMGKLGLVKNIRPNSGTYTISAVKYSGGTIDQWPGYPDPSTTGSPPSFMLGDEPHTLVTVVEPLTTPSYSWPELYSAFIRLPSLAITEVLSYSNATYIEDGFPGLYKQTPDEGISRRNIVAVSTNTVEVFGNWDISNIAAGDKIRIIGSTSNDGTYTVSSIAYDLGTNRTILGVVESLASMVASGVVEVDIPSNVFIVNGNHVSRFNQGELFTVVGGPFAGRYVTLTSDYSNGQTRIRPTQSIINVNEGIRIDDVGSGFVVRGNLTTQFPSGSAFNVVGSLYNDGSYIVDSSFVSLMGSPPAQYTTIIPTSSFVPDASGEIHFVFSDPGSPAIPNAGVIKESSLIGFGESYSFCDFIEPSPMGAHPPENTANALIIDTLKFNWGWGSSYKWEIIGTDAINSTVYIAGEMSGMIHIDDIVFIVDSLGNDGDYQVVSTAYNSTYNRTEIELLKLSGGSPNTLPVDPIGSPSPYGFLVLEGADVTNWFQYSLWEARPCIGSPCVNLNAFVVYGDATKDIQQSQQFRISGTVNDGLYTASMSPIYNASENTTLIFVVESIATHSYGGWIESARDYGIRLVFEDSVGVSVSENATGAVLELGGNMVGSWDYNYWDIGSWDEDLGTVLNLYSS